MLLQKTIMKRKNYLKNKVFIIGAGPGDCELITMKGLKILEKADCVIYDYLVNKKLLKYAPKTAELINADNPRNSFSDGFVKEQDKLNNLIIDKSKKYKTVVRLKNGDAVIFGRLNEEISALAACKIDFEIIPGVTAASSSAASLNLGLTKTKTAPVVLFAAGHGNPFCKNSSIDYKKLPHRATLVFYMAGKNIGRLCDKLTAVGWDKNTFCGVVENASLPTEKKRLGKLKNIKKIVGKGLSGKSGVKPPVVFLVGDVLRNAIKKK